MRIPTDQKVLAISGRFFYYFCTVQGGIAYILTALVGPSLISPDLVNGALPLYFCRPFSRTQYVMGKLGVLLALLSLITWIPGLLLYLIQSSVAGSDWMFDNLWLAWGLFLGLMVWIIVLSLIALALSAWVKWKIAAGALVLGVFFAGAGFGNAINSVLRTNNGALIDLTQVAHTMQADLLRYDSGTEMSTDSAWLVLALVSAMCLPPLLLARRVRAFEVVKFDGRADPVRQHLAASTAKCWGESRHPVDPARHHEFGGTQWLGQDHVDEPDERSGSPNAGKRERAGDFAE